MVKLIFCLALFLLFDFQLKVQAQNLQQFNHYIANQGLLNPAYNGTRDIMSGILLHRSQWIGLDGAPMNQALNVHGPIEGTNVGLGLVLANDRIGFTNTFDFFGAASYKVQLDQQDRFLSLGLQFGLSSLVYDGTKAIVNDLNDPVWNGKQSKLNFNFGFGTYYYNTDYFLGFSIPKFFSDQFDYNNMGFTNTIDFKNIHMFLYGGYVFEIYPVIVKPTMLMRHVYGAPLQFDLSVNALFAEQFWVGLSYRTISEMVVLFEYVINHQYTIRYSFDFPFSPINNFARAGSHEIGIQFDFTLNRRPGMRSIRYF